MTRRVIINADEMGIDEPRSHGILEAHEKGVVTSASLMANSPHLESLGTRLKEHPRLGVGVHLNLTEGSPILSHPRTLSDRQGRFFEKTEARRRLMEGRLDLEEIRSEFDLQIRRIKDAGIEPSHLDSLHHIHVYPGVMAAACWAAKRHGIQKVRLPREPVPVPGSVAPQVYWEVVRYQGLVSKAAEVLFAEGLKTSDHFRGIAVSGGVHFDRFVDLLARLPEGTTEVMVRPGLREPGSKNFGSEDRERELRILTDPETRSAIAQYGLELISYHKL
ncbi:MAG TPA: ChbG/HpnK family deacetylase [Candidatus Polarisedimenticolia bacterium]|nr:ChbG/HpnK family deacetylase [Candidatus Polarisedimenticolia bacterium]